MNLEMWIIYDHPRDLPAWWVARRWLVDGTTPAGTPTNEKLLAASIESLRDTLRNWGLTCLTRHPDDDPNIVETWL